MLTLKRKEERTPVELAAQAVDRLVRKQPRGDILIFMPTEQDIRETCETLGGRNYLRTVILPLFARLGAAEQRRGLCLHRGPQDHRGHQRGRDVHHHSGHPLRGGHGAGADIPVCAPVPDHLPAGGAHLPKQCRPAPGTMRAGGKTGSASVFIPRRTTSTGPCSPSRRSCDPTWPRSSCA